MGTGGDNQKRSSPSERQELFVRLTQAILEYDGEKAKRLTEEILERRINVIDVMAEAIAAAATRVGELFERGEIFIPHLSMAGSIMSEVSAILQASAPSGVAAFSGKTVVIGTVEGDIHSIGKNIVSMMLKSNGFVVHDLGVDVKSSRFIQQAEAVHADIIAVSSLLTTTMPYQKDVISELEEMGLRSRYKVIVGGGPVSAEWAREIGADGYGRDAIDAVKTAKSLLGLD